MDVQGPVWTFPAVSWNCKPNELFSPSCLLSDEVFVKETVAKLKQAVCMKITRGSKFITTLFWIAGSESPADNVWDW